MNDAEGELSGQIQSRLASVMDAGVGVVSPTPAEDTAGHASAPVAEGAYAGWTVALRLEAPARKPERVTGSGPTPDAAAKVVPRLEESEGPTPG